MKVYGCKKRETIVLPGHHLRPKRSAKSVKMMSEIPEGQYVGIGLHMESMFSGWCAMEFLRLLHFIIQLKCNWMCWGDDVNGSGVLVEGAKWFFYFLPKYCLH